MQLNEKNDLEILAIIPARGGSLGIPGKNLQPLGSKPLLAHTINAAKEAKSIKRIVVSTDDQDIASLAESLGVEVVWRLEELSSSTSSSESALLHVLDHLHAIENYSPELLVFLQCTSPFTVADDIDGAIKTLFEKKADSVLAVTPVHSFLWEFNEDDEAVAINHNKGIRKLRQENANQYLETGAVYVMKVSGFIEARHRFFGKTTMFIIPRDRSIEIDEPLDLEIAEKVYLNRQNH